MFKVECPGCKAPYQVDERRIPPNGLKMRCPKCGASFNVDPPPDTPEAGPNLAFDAAFGPGTDSIPPPALAPKRDANLKGTTPGMATRVEAPKALDRAAAPKAGQDPDLPSAVPQVGLPATVPNRGDSKARIPPPVPPRLARAGGPPPRPAKSAKSPEAKPVPQSPDLPSLPGAAESARARTSARAFGEIELDLPSPVPPPTPEVREGLPHVLDLPGAADSPRIARAKADSSAGIDLPEVASELPAQREIDLPDTAGAGLPDLATSGLPNVATSGLPNVATSGLPNVATSGSPVATQNPLTPEPTQGSPHRLDSFGELDLPLITSPPSSVSQKAALDALEADPFGEAVLASPSPVSAPGARSSEAESAQGEEGVLVREQGGGTSYGEVNLSPSDDAEMRLDEAPPRALLRRDDDMEFGGVPQEDPGSVRPQISLPAARSAGNRPAQPLNRRRGLLKVFIPLSVLLVGGASLALVPALGPFGAYWVHDQLRAGEIQGRVEKTVVAARKRLQADSYPEAYAAWKEVEAARGAAKRVYALAAYSSFLGFSRELRFGPDPEAHAKARVLLEELSGQQDAAYLNLARAARAATEGQLARARQLLSGVLKRSPPDPDALALAGEVELRAKEAKAALEVWTRLVQAEQSARARYGLARAKFAVGDAAGAEQEAEQAVQKNPSHVGARILIARIAAATRAREPAAVETLTQITKSKDASKNELVLAFTLLGDIHLARSRISHAEFTYTEALRRDPKAARALVGLGEALYRAGRYSEAQARFEAGSQADPDDLISKVGVGKSKLMLERVDEAHALLKKLHESHPTSASAAYWYGRVLEALGTRDQAEQVYSRSIERTPGDPSLVDTYIALALLQTQQGRVEDAKKTLNGARTNLPNSSAIYRALGEVALSGGRFPEAQGEFTKAIELDPEDLAARFKLGVALRRDGQFDAAQSAFDAVKAVDRDYPGLALEHGLLYEASGRMEEALRAYEGALAKAPEDPDLMLRVGCGYASAGRSKDAQELLRRVLTLRPTSTETNHCLGRALLAEGSRLADALRFLDRAAELDPHRAEYHLYVGWAANEAGNVAKAERALDQAIKLDRSLADAYWQRGVLRGRQGAVRDAIADLNRALQLRPSRHEAHAALADAYYDFGKEGQALVEWKKAVLAQPENATWRFRYGKLLAANQKSAAARTELAKAIALAEQSPEQERWLWEAHHMLARAIGLSSEAAVHWEQFLTLGPIDSPYRGEAQAALQKLGRPWSGN